MARLIRELGAADYSKRQAADEQLARLGGQSRSQLEQALADDDVEVRLRAKRLLERLKLDELWAAEPVGISGPTGNRPRRSSWTWPSASGNHIYVGDPYGNFAEKTLDDQLRRR